MTLGYEVFELIASIKNRLDEPNKNPFTPAVSRLAADELTFEDVISIGVRELPWIRNRHPNRNNLTHRSTSLNNAAICSASHRWRSDGDPVLDIFSSLTTLLASATCLENEITV